MKYHVITVMTQRFPDWVFKGWYELQEALNQGWEIERVDEVKGFSGWKGIRNGGLVYVLRNPNI